MEITKDMQFERALWGCGNDYEEGLTERKGISGVLSGQIGEVPLSLVGHISVVVVIVELIAFNFIGCLTSHIVSEMR